MVEKICIINSNKLFFAIIVSLGIITVNAQQLADSNPLLPNTNSPIPFDKISVNHINEATAIVLAESDSRIKKIVAIPPGNHTFFNTIKAFDELYYNVVNLFFKLRLISSAYENDSIRNAGRKGEETLSLYLSNLYLKEELYRALKQYESSEEAKKLSANQKKFLRDAILLFEKNGIKLDVKAKMELEVINRKLVFYSTQFIKNIIESKDSVSFSEKALTGVPGKIKEPWLRTDGNYVVYINEPNYNDILKYATDGETRRSMYIYYSNRAYPENLAVLDSLYFYRHLYARKLGFNSFAEYTLVGKMADKPQNVWNFLNDLRYKLSPKAKNYLFELRTFKQRLKLEANDSLYAWDIDFYQNKLLDTKYKLNTDEVKQHFEINNTVQGMFSVYEKLFNIRIKETKSVPVWQAKVKAYEMYKDGKKTGNFYMDMFPRKNKRIGAAVQAISLHHKEGEKETLPVSVLICNFPEGNIKTPSLLDHSEVVVLFHEFGHLVHSMVARSDIASQHIGAKQDFIEAPSQFLENWCWQYESLRMFARHYKTGEPLPESLFNKIKQTKLLDRRSGILFKMGSLYNSVLDFTYTDKYDSIKGKDLNHVAKDLFVITQLPFVEESHFICNFRHLTSYGAQYYGYMWSRVFADDMFTVFHSSGVMNSDMGIRYRKEVLEKWATMEEMDILRNFLGREPNSDAFLKSLGIQ